MTTRSWILSLLALGLVVPAWAGQTQELAKGIVFHDKNQNGVRDDDEEGIAGIKVSNGREIVRTDDEGRYEIPVDDDTIIFVIKPRDWMTPVDEFQIPQFYYIHKPDGSPPLEFPGVEPTGPLPESVDFALYRRWEPKTFRALFFGDTQPRNQREVDYIAHDVIEPIIAELDEIDPSFGVTLGDVVFDDLDVFDPLKKTIALIGIPWYNVIGNHDLNFDAKIDKHSDETWERHFGPSYYSFDHGPVHFIALDDVLWYIPEGEDRGQYKGGLGPEQMEFIKNDLAMIPEDQLVVLMMHIPLTNVEDREELYRLIEKRPFCMSVSAHTHYQEHRFITSEDGFQGPEPHHHVINVTVCGSWWSGAPDETGIPHTMMRDGAPNGYAIFTFDGHDYSIEFRAARRPKHYQMNIHAEEEVEADKASDAEVVVNVFGGSVKSVVNMRLGDDGDWVELEQVRMPDPYFAKLKELEEGDNPPPGRTLPNIMDSGHIWRGTLPANPPKGTHTIQVETTDMFGQTYSESRVIRVR